MNQEVAKAFTDVFEIINHLSEDTKAKIPTKFVDIIEKNKDNNYKSNIRYDIPLEQQSLSMDTKLLINYLYNTYLIKSI